MGHLNDHDPANTRALTRSRLGLGRETQQFRTGHYPNPARGGTRGYPLWLRTVAINVLNESTSLFHQKCPYRSRWYILCVC